MSAEYAKVAKDESVGYDESSEVVEEDKSSDGCCKALCEKEEVQHDVDPNRHRHCRDTLCIVIFGVFWVFLLGMFAFVWAYGDVNRLVYPSDYNGFMCGVDTGNLADGKALRSGGNLKNYTHATFPRLANDVASVMHGDTCDDMSECTIELFAVCTDKCPKQGDVVCTYQVEEADPPLSQTEKRQLAHVGSAQHQDSGCWFTPIDTVDYFGRCIPWPEKLQTETYTCRDAGDNSVVLYRGPEMCYSPASLSSSDPVDDELSWSGDFILESEEECKAVMERDAWRTNAGCVPDDDSNPLRGHTVLRRDPCRVPQNRDLCLSTPGCAYVGPLSTPPPGRRPTDCSGVVTKLELSSETTTGGGDVLMAMLVSYTTVAQQIFEDVISTRGLVLLCGSLVSTLLGFSFLLLLYIFAPCIVWGIVIAVFGAFGVCDAYVSLKAGEFLSWDISNLTSTVQSEAEIISANTDPGQNLDVNEWIAIGNPDNIVYWKIASYLLTVLWVMYTCLIICGTEKIQLCIKVITNASDMVGTVPGIILVPLFIYALQLGFMLFFAFYIMMLKSVDSFTASDLHAAAAASCHQCVTDSSDCLKDCIDTGLKAFNTTPEEAASATEEANLVFYMMWVAFFAFLWTANTLSGIGTIVMSRSVADNYWHDPSDEQHPLPRSPTLNALAGTLFYHVGSAIFGGLLIAIVQLVRAIIEYIDRQTKALREYNSTLECVFKVLACCSWCAEKVVKYLTSNAYICVAITGKAFMPSAWEAFKILLKNPARCAIVQSVSWVVLWLGKISITFGATLIFYYLISTDPAYLQPTLCAAGVNSTRDDGLCGGEHEISDPRLPCICTAVMAFCVAHVFMNAYGVTSDTLLLSLCLDEQYQEEGLYDGKPLYWVRGEQASEAAEKLENFKAQFDDDKSSWCGRGRRVQETAPSDSAKP